MTPAVKIGWGIGLVLVGLLLLAAVWPLALLILVAGGGLVWYGVKQQKEPMWRIRSLVHKAQRNPVSRNALLEQALRLDPNNPEALAANAENAYHADDWTKASELYQRYLVAAPDDEEAEFHLGLSYLNAGNLDLALQHLEKIRAKSTLGTQPRLINAVAIAFVRKGDPGQALELLKTLSLRSQNLDEQQQQCLFLRSIAHYEMHQTSSAVGDLERLYAINPTFPELETTRDAMKTGTFMISAVQFHVS